MKHKTQRKNRVGFIRLAVLSTLVFSLTLPPANAAYYRVSDVINKKEATAIEFKMEDAEKKSSFDLLSSGDNDKYIEWGKNFVKSPLKAAVAFHHALTEKMVPGDIHSVLHNADGIDGDTFVVDKVKKYSLMKDLANAVIDLQSDLGAAKFDKLTQEELIKKLYEAKAFENWGITDKKFDFKAGDKDLKAEVEKLQKELDDVTKKYINAGHDIDRLLADSLNALDSKDKKDDAKDMNKRMLDVLRKCLAFFKAGGPKKGTDENQARIAQLEKQLEDIRNQSQAAAAAADAEKQRLLAEQERLNQQFSDVLNEVALAEADRAFEEDEDDNFDVSQLLPFDTSLLGSRNNARNNIGAGLGNQGFSPFGFGQNNNNPIPRRRRDDQALDPNLPFFNQFGNNVGPLVRPLEADVDLTTPVEEFGSPAIINTGTQEASEATSAAEEARTLPLNSLARANSFAATSPFVAANFASVAIQDLTAKKLIIQSDLDAARADQERLTLDLKRAEQGKAAILQTAEGRRARAQVQEFEAQLAEAQRAAATAEENFNALANAGAQGQGGGNQAELFRQEAQQARAAVKALRKKLQDAKTQEFNLEAGLSNQANTLRNNLATISSSIKTLTAQGAAADTEIRNAQRMVDAGNIAAVPGGLSGGITGGANFAIQQALSRFNNMQGGNIAGGGLIPGRLQNRFGGVPFSNVTQGAPSASGAFRGVLGTTPAAGTNGGRLVVQ